MGTTSKVIYGSDDEEDDISNEYESHQNSTSIRSSSNASHRDNSHAEHTAGNSADGVDQAMHEAHTGLFEETPSINITDQSGYIDLNSMTAATSLKRNRTTMEQLSSKRTTCSSKSRLVEGPSPDHEVPDADDEDLAIPRKKQKRAKSTTELLLTQPSEPKSQSKRSDSTNFDMPSSNETHAAGSKQIDSPEMFRTQTTVPFSATQALAPTQVATPIVLVPRMDQADGAFSSAQNKDPTSSAVLNEQIDGIDNWLQDEIAQGHAAGQQEPVIELPDTDPGEMVLPETMHKPKEADSATIDPQTLMLDATCERSAAEAFESSDALNRDNQLDRHAGRPGSKKHRQSSFDDVKEGAWQNDNESKSQSERRDREVFEDFEEGLPPPEMYKPRPSKSRGRRATVDPSTTHELPQPTEPPKKKKQKRRKTAGDFSAQIEIINLDEAATVRSDIGKHDQPKELTEAEARRSMESTGARAQSADANHKDVSKTWENTVDLVDVAVETEAKVEVPVPAPKKKRGRPKKADKQAKQDLDHAGKADQAEQVGHQATTDVVSKSEPEPGLTLAGKKRHRKTTTQSYTSNAADDSEDELAGNSKPGNDFETKDEKPQAQDFHSHPDEQAEEEGPIKPPAKRGRKPKAKQSAPETVSMNLEPDTAGKENPEQQLQSGISAPAPEPTRSPLKEKTSPQNQSLSNGPGLAATRSASPETTTPAPETPKSQAGGIAAKPSPLTAGKGKVPYRVGLSRRMRIEPLLKTLKR